MLLLFVCGFRFSSIDSASVRQILRRIYSLDSLLQKLERKVVGSIPDEVIGFFIWPNPSSRTMVSGSTRLLTEMSTRNLPGGRARSATKGDNLTAICEPTV
jgi:hypothetical protein